MTNFSRSNPPHLLVFEPRVEGHHLTYLRYVTEDFLSAGYKLTLALDLRPEARLKIEKAIGELLPSVNLISAFENEASAGKTDKLSALLHSQKQASADFIFLTSLDEIASACFRRAAFGRFPDTALQGRIGGIYFRPRMLEANAWSPNQWIKKMGFQRMVRNGWFKKILLCDEFLCAKQKSDPPHAPFQFLPDPFPDNFEYSSPTARQQLCLPTNKKIFLFYGGPYRRKGLHLVIDAMQQIPVASDIFLLCVGQQPPDSGLAESITALEMDGRAKLINRYVSDEEEKLSFAASDFVLLPYIKHFGSSGVLARAVGAHKPVIASDEELIGRRVREHKLGLLFRSENSFALSIAMKKACDMTAEQYAEISAAVAKHAQTCTRQKFREALVTTFA